MKKLLFICALSVLFLVACGDSEPKTIDEAVESVTKKPYEVKENDGLVSISITDDTLHEGSKSVILKRSKELFAQLSKVEGVSSVTLKWLSDNHDAYGNTSTGEILSVMLDAETFKKIDWSNLENVDIEAIATGYKQHDALKN